MRHLANAQYWDRPAGGNTGRLFLAFGGPVCADRFSNCPLDRVLTYKNLIYLLNLQYCLKAHIVRCLLSFSITLVRAEAQLCASKTSLETFAYCSIGLVTDAL